MSSVRLGTTTTYWGARGSEITRRASGPSFACKAAKRPSSSAEPGSGTSIGVDGVEITLVTPIPRAKIIREPPVSRRGSLPLRISRPIARYYCLRRLPPLCGDEPCLLVGDGDAGDGAGIESQVISLGASQAKRYPSRTGATAFFPAKDSTTPAAPLRTELSQPVDPAPVETMMPLEDWSSERRPCVRW